MASGNFYALKINVAMGFTLVKQSDKSNVLTYSQL